MAEPTPVAAQHEDRLYASLLTVASAPHVKAKETIPKIMWTVNATLLPVAAWAVYVFGLRALWQMLLCTATAMATEAVIQKIRGMKRSWWDGSAFLTGLLLAMCIPVGLPFWMSVLGVVFAISIVKHVFGGLGQNIFNPAHAGRAFLLASFPVQMTTWSVMTSKAAGVVDGVTTATPLGIWGEHGMKALLDTMGGRSELYASLFFGQVNGSIGEVSALLILLGGAVLIFKRYIFWQGPVFYIGTVALLGWILGGPGWFDGDPLFHVLSGGLMIGAFYMLTDMVTSPVTARGQVIFAVGAGILVILIRRFGGYPEGVCYSILLMNAVTPLIDRFIKPAQFKEES